MKSGEKVAWNYGNGSATGKVKSVHKKSVTIQSGGSSIKRNGDAKNPALVIKHESDKNVVKRKSEVRKTKAS